MSIKTAQRRSIPLSRLLLLTVGSLVLLAGGSVLLLLRATSEHLLLNAGSRTLLRTMDVIELVVRTQLDPAQTQVESVGRLMQDPQFDLSNPDRVANVLQGALAATPQVRLLVFCDREMQFISAVRDADAETITVEQYDGSDDKIAQSLAATMRHAQRARWGELIAAQALDRELLNVSFPIRAGGEYQGFLAAGVTTREMSRVAASIQELMGVSTCLTLDTGKILAHPALADGEESESAGKLFELLSSSRNESSLVTIRDTDATDAADALGEVETFEFEFEGEQYAGFTRSLDDYGKPPLAIGAYCSAKIILAPMQLLYTTAAISFFVIGVALAFAAWLSRAVAQPIRRVSAGVAQIGQLDLSDVGEMSSSRLREVDELASSFNRMLWALRAFSTYVPMKLANQVVQGVVGAQVASEERELTVMFTDIVSFTSLSEGMNAVEVADFINDHLTMLAQCVEETGGTIDKYIGDALMAFWGAPQRMENTSAAACRAAALMAQRLREDNLQRLAAGKQPIRLRIGIHTGPLVVGNIGAPGRINYTVVGDTVNVAQRLESLGKQVDADAEFVALLSSATADHLADEFTLHAEGEFQLRGKQHDVGVLRLQV